jgi:hypothetical protein
MSLPRQSPNSFRYLKARLRILKRPMVWGSASALILAVILFAEYWNHADWFNLPVAESDRSSSTGVASLDSLPESTANIPDREGSAIGGDIDSLPVLINGLNAGQSPAGSQSNQDKSNNTQQPSSVPSSAPASPSPQSQPNQNPLASRNNPFLSNSQDSRPFNLNLPILNQDSGGSDSTFSAASNPAATAGFASGTDLLANPSQPAFNSSSPLQTVIERMPSASSEPTSTSRNSQPQPGTPSVSSQPQGVPTQALPTRTVTPNLAPSPLPMSPPLGSTGYTMPPTLRSAPSSAPASAPTYTNPTGYQMPPALRQQNVPSASTNQSGLGQTNVQTSPYNSNLPGGAVNPYQAPLPNSGTNP